MKFTKDTYRIVSTLKKEAETNGDVETLAKATREKEEIENKIKELETVDKEVYMCMLLRYIYGYSIPKVAYRSHMSEATVKRRIAKGEMMLNN